MTISSRNSELAKACATHSDGLANLGLLRGALRNAVRHSNDILAHASPTASRTRREQLHAQLVTLAAELDAELEPTRQQVEDTYQAVKAHTSPQDHA